MVTANAAISSIGRSMIVCPDVPLSMSVLLPGKGRTMVRYCFIRHARPRALRVVKQSARSAPADPPYVKQQKKGGRIARP